MNFAAVDEGRAPVGLDVARSGQHRDPVKNVMAMHVRYDRVAPAAGWVKNGNGESQHRLPRVVSNDPPHDHALRPVVRNAKKQQKKKKRRGGESRLFHWPPSLRAPPLELSGGRVTPSVAG